MSSARSAMRREYGVNREIPQRDRPRTAIVASQAEITPAAKAITHCVGDEGRVGDPGKSDRQEEEEHSERPPLRHARTLARERPPERASTLVGQP